MFRTNDTIDIFVTAICDFHRLSIMMDCVSFTIEAP